MQIGRQCWSSKRKKRVNNETISRKIFLSIYRAYSEWNLSFKGFFTDTYPLLLYIVTKHAQKREEHLIWGESFRWRGRKSTLVLEWGLGAKSAVNAGAQPSSRREKHSWQEKTTLTSKKGSKMAIRFTFNVLSFLQCNISAACEKLLRPPF